MTVKLVAGDAVYRVATTGGGLALAEVRALALARLVAGGAATDDTCAEQVAVKYKDADGDLVACVTDDDLAMAPRTAQPDGGVEYKLWVAVQPRPPTPSRTSSSASAGAAVGLSSRATPPASAAPTRPASALPYTGGGDSNSSNDGAGDAHSPPHARPLTAGAAPPTAGTTSVGAAGSLVFAGRSASVGSLGRAESALSTASYATRGTGVGAWVRPVREAVRGRFLGAGSFGRVYAGIDVDSGAPIAIKEVAINVPAAVMAAAHAAAGGGSGGGASLSAPGDGPVEGSGDGSGSGGAPGTPAAAPPPATALLDLERYCKVDARVRSLQREIQLLSALDHENIIRYLGMAVSEATSASRPQVLATGAAVRRSVAVTATIVIYLEQATSGSVKDLIKEYGPLPESLVARYARDMMRGLAYLHSKGILHRDIKPGNVMITPNGQVKVMDFGIARAISESSANVAQTSAVLGTASYFSPEQARGEAVDARTDLYSTGVVLYEMLTGRAPFRGDSPVAVAYQHVSELPTPPNAVNPSVSPAMSAVVMHALAKDRFERFQSAAEFKADLEVAAGGKVPDRAPGSDDFNATLFGVNPNSTAASEATLRRLANDENRPTRTQSRPPVAWIWGGIAVMVVIIVAAMVWVFSLSPTNIAPDLAVKVPDVVGEQAESGIQTLTDAGLTPHRIDQASTKVDAGLIISTSIDAGTKVSKGEDIDVVVSTGPPSVNLPTLTYLAEADAITKIQELGLVYGTSSSQNHPSIPAGQVIGFTLGDDTSMMTGSQTVPAGSTVNLVLSTGLVTVADFVGQPVTDAQAALQQLQLSVALKPDGSCGGGNVTAQSAKGDVPQRSTITLTYCQGS